MPVVAIDRLPHVITVGTTKVSVVLPDYYNDIGTIVGVTKSTGKKPELGLSSNELLRLGQAVRVRVSYAVGAKRKTADLLCDVDKARTAVNDLVGKSFRGSRIKTAYFPRRVRFH